MTGLKCRAVLAVLLVIALLLSLSLPILEAGHTCSGSGCHVCAQIRACIRRLQNLILAAVFSALLQTSLRLFCVLCRRTLCSLTRCTLISLKVKLSD